MSPVTGARPAASNWKTTQWRCACGLEKQSVPRAILTLMSCISLAGKFAACEIRERHCAASPGP